MIFNTVQFDAETKNRMNQYRNVMDRFTRFQIQVIAKCNNIPFKWGVTPKRIIIDMMANENIRIPTDDNMAEYMRQYRAELANGKPAAKAEIKDVAPEIEDVKEDIVKRSPGRPKLNIGSKDKESVDGEDAIKRDE